MPSRILIHVEHPAGCGPLAAHLAAAGHEVTVAHGGPPDGQFAGVKLVQLPIAPAAPSDGDWEALRWTATHRLAAELRPDLLIVELFPFGRRDLAFELTPLIQIVVARGGRVAVSLPATLAPPRDPALDRDAAAFTRDWADLILVEGDPAAPPLEVQVPALADLAGRLRYAGGDGVAGTVAALKPLL